MYDPFGKPMPAPLRIKPLSKAPVSAEEYEWLKNSTFEKTAVTNTSTVSSDIAKAHSALKDMEAAIEKLKAAHIKTALFETKKEMTVKAMQESFPDPLRDGLYNSQATADEILKIGHRETRQTIAATALEIQSRGLTDQFHQKVYHLARGGTGVMNLTDYRLFLLVVGHASGFITDIVRSGNPDAYGAVNMSGTAIRSMLAMVEETIIDVRDMKVGAHGRLDVLANRLVTRVNDRYFTDLKLYLNARGLLGGQAGIVIDEFTDVTPAPKPLTSEQSLLAVDIGGTW